MTDLDDPAALRESQATHAYGGKGANLLVMRQDLDLPVPPGFILSTAAYRHWRESGWSQALATGVAAHVARLERALGLSFGGSAAPLLVSVRSSGAVSMPGMMDTVLNVGATPDSIAALAMSDARFAYDSWRRFCEAYAYTVLRLPRAAADLQPEATGSASLAQAHAIRRHAAAHARPIPDDAAVQLRAAIEAVFASWDSERARAYRRHEHIDDSTGTAVVVQAMVFGNAGADCGTGVVFSRDPVSGEDRPSGDFATDAQGEDVVSGEHRTDDLARMRAALPGPYAQLLESLGKLERHFGDMCDVEFTVERGRLWILQTRAGKRSPLAAVRIAVEMAEDPGFALDRAAAVRRVSAAQVRSLLAQRTLVAGAVPLTIGTAASPGVASGGLCSDSGQAARLAEAGQAIVLVRPTTSPEDVHGLMGARAVVTATGNIMSHAAVVARGWGIPAVTAADVQFMADGIRVGGQWLAHGAVVTVDGTGGGIYAGDCTAAGSSASRHLERLRAWSQELDVPFGGEPRQAVRAAHTGVPLNELSVLRAIQLRGVIKPGALEEVLFASAAAISEALATSAAAAGSQARIMSGPAGLLLTATGHSWVEAAVRAEREALRESAPDGWLEAQFGRFAALDHSFKRVVTDWQLRPVGASSVPNDHADAKYDATVLAALGEVHAAVRPLLDEVAVRFPRLAPMGQRLDRALQRVRGGRHASMASPREDSYHTVWFELHEELIQLSGRTRQSLET